MLSLAEGSPWVPNGRDLHLSHSWAKTRAYLFPYANCCSAVPPRAAPRDNDTTAVIHLVPNGIFNCVELSALLCYYHRPVPADIETEELVLHVNANHYYTHNIGGPDLVKDTVLSLRV